MKIACTGNGWYPDSGGGLDRYLQGLIEQLASDGDDVDAFLVGAPRERRRNLRFVSLCDPAQPMAKRMLAAARAYAANRREPYDVVNMHFALYAVPFVPFLPAATPVVCNFHGPWAAEGTAEGNAAHRARAKRLLERTVYSRAARAIVLSTAFKEILARDYGFPSDRIDVIPPGLDLDFFTPGDRRAARARLGWPQDRFIAFTARRLVNRVGVGELIEAAAILKAQGSAAWIPIAGKGYKRPEFEAAIARLGLEQHVSLLGFVSEDDLRTAYRAADVTVLPAQELEGYGYIIPESLAAGTPVIATPVGGAPEALAPLSRELVLESREPAGIARGIRQAEAAEMALPSPQRCRAFAAATYPWSSVAERVREVFSLAIHEHRRPRVYAPVRAR